MGTLHEDQYTFLITSCSVLLRMRNVSDKSCKENQNTHFMFNNFFLKNHAVYEIMWKSVVELCGPWQYDVCTLHAEYLKLQAHTQNCFSSVTMVARMHLNIMLCLHCLSLFLLFCSKLRFSCLNVSVYFSLPSHNFSFASLSFLSCLYSPHFPTLASCYTEFESGSISLIFIFCLFS
jgi:hypothetical protein